MGLTGDKSALRLSYALLACGVITLCVLRITFTASWSVRQPLASLLVVLMLGVQCCYLTPAPRPGSLPGTVRRRAGPALLVAAAALDLPFLLWRTPWAGAPSVLAVVILLSLPSAWAWWLVAAEAAGLMGYAAALHAGVVDVMYAGTTLVEDTIWIYLVVQLTATVRRLHATQASLAEMAVMSERLRASADLRAAIGDGLTEIAACLRPPTAVQPDLDRVIAVARGCLADARTVARRYRTAGPPPASPAGLDVPVTVARRAGLAAVLPEAIQAVTDLWLPSRPDAARLALTIGCWIVICVLQYRHCAPARPKGWGWTLAAQAAVTAALAWPDPWGAAGAAAMLAASVVLLAPRPCCWLPAGALLGADLGIVAYLRPFGTAGTITQMVAIAQFALIIYAVARLGTVSTELSRSRDRVASLAALRERLRLAQDVHDLLGLGLSAITMRAELAARLLPHDPDRALAELSELPCIVASAQADLRSVTVRASRLSFAAEFASVRAVLTAAGITVRARLLPEPLPDQADALFAVVLREAVTNVLRHSQASCCEIVTEARSGLARSGLALRVGNDGAPGPATGADRQSAGLSNLADRLGQAKGTLTTACADGTFALTAWLPAPAPPSEPAGLDGDADRVEAVAGAELADR